MKQKFLYLFLTTLLCLTGGGKLWADQVTFNTTSGNLTTPQDEISLSWAGDGSGLQSDNLKIPKGSTLTISTSSRFIQSIEMTLKSGQVYATQYVTANVGSTAYDDTNKKYTWTGIAKSIVFTNANESGARDFRPVSIVVTYTTTDPSTVNDATVQTYPYTWDFTSGSSLWETSLEELELFTAQWSDDTTTGDYRPTTASTIDWGFNISILKGLRFNPVSVSNSPGLDYNLKHLWIAAGTTITIPSVKAGQIIALTGPNVNVTNTSNLTQVTANSQYTVDANGDVTLTFNNSHIYTISVLKTDVTLTKRGTWPTTKTYGDAAFNVMLNYSSGTPTTKSLWTIEKVSGDDGVITWSDIDGNKGFNSPNNWMSFNSLTPGAIGSVTLRFKFIGNDAFNPAWIEETFTVNKTAQNLSFAEPSYTINYGVTGVSHIPTLSPATGATITYSSSDNSVATVNESTGVITTVNSGTCTITATAAETAEYAEATASYKLIVNGTQNPTLAWSSSNNFTYSGDVCSAEDLQYGNNKTYTAYVSDADGSGVTSSAIRYGLVEGYEGYLTIDDKKGVIAPTRKFADEDLDDKEVEVYAQIPASGPRNAARITYKVKIVKGLLADNFFKENELYVNVNHTIAPKNNLQSMRWEDIDAITVTFKTGSGAAAVPGTGESTVTDYKTATPKATYFDTKTATSGNDKGKEIVDWFYPIFKGLAEGTVTYTVTMSSKLYGDLSGDITLHVLEDGTTTGFDWAVGTQSEYTIYEGDYMFLPEITGNTNGNFSYSSGYDNQNTHHKYVYTRRWDGSQYVTTYNNKNFHKGEGFPNFDLTSDAEGTTAVTEVQADGSNVALLFWNTGSGTENDRLLIYGNKAGTVYLKASDPQITSRALSTIKIVVKSKTDINADFESLKSSMTFPYTWDFTTDYDWSAEIETGTGNWTLNGSHYDLGMSSNFNYDYADEDKDGIVWGNDNNDPNTNSSELTDKLLVGKDDKVLRGFAGMKIRLGNNGTGSWHSKRDGIHILSYTNSNTPRLSVPTGQHTLILPTPTGANCPATFKVFVKAKALATGEGTLWVRKANIDRNASGQNSYYDFKNASEGADIIYSVDATKDTPLELDLEKVAIYWIAYSTEAKNFAKFDNTSYYATTYSYPKDLDMDKSLNDVNTTVQPYYASAFNSADAVTMTAVSKSSHLAANTGVLLKSDENPGSCYMIAKPQNSTSVPEATSYATNYLKPNAEAGKVYGRDEVNNKTRFVLAYRYIWVKADGTTDGVYKPCSDWSFVRAASTGATMSKNTAYLEVPGDIYVMMDVSNAARRAPEVDSENDSADGDENYPATKQLLNIVFEEEQPATPEDPATEEPEDEDGDSDKDKDRPRKPGDDGWPKPPFPPIIITDIDNVKTNEADNAVWHSMEGVRISQPTKPGLYIRNGKKIVIK